MYFFRPRSKTVLTLVKRTHIYDSFKLNVQYIGRADDEKGSVIIGMSNNLQCHEISIHLLARIACVFTFSNFFFLLTYKNGDVLSICLHHFSI